MGGMHEPAVAHVRLPRTLQPSDRPTGTTRARWPRVSVTELGALLEEARTAEPARRIESRDAIAAYGAIGIEGVRPWLRDEVLAAFAVRVIEQAGLRGEPELAAKVLRSARKQVPAGVADDVEWALARLRGATSRAATG